MATRHVSSFSAAGSAGFTRRLNLRSVAIRNSKSRWSIARNFFLFTPMLHEIAASDLRFDEHRQSRPQDDPYVKLFLVVT